MAISSYLKRCGYQQNELKNVLYLIPKTATKKVHIDGDEAYVEYSGDTLSIIKIKGNNLAFQEDTSFDDRFRFDKTITLTFDGYITFKDFYSKYYAIVEDKSGTFWMVNADFPSYVTYTYTLNDGENKTDLVFYAASNIPTIKLANFNPDNAEECETYMPYGIENLKLLEKNKSKISTYNKTVSTHDDFKYVEAIDGTYELTEEFNGETYSTQLSFSIPLSVYKASWHVKLLEFEKNKYCGYLILKNSDYKAFLGYNTGLFPSYVINGDIVTITLTESSNYGMVFDDEYAVINTDLPNSIEFFGATCKNYNFESSCDWNVESKPNYITITPTSGNAGTQYTLQVCNTDTETGYAVSEFVIKSCSARFSPEVIIKNPLYRYTATTDTICVEAEERKHSGSTYCGGSHNVDKYVNIIREISYDSGETWYTSSSSELIEANSPDCGFRTRTVSTGYTCDGMDKYQLIESQESYDYGNTWVTVSSSTGSLIEEFSPDCGYDPSPEPLSGQYFTIEVLEDDSDIVFQVDNSTDVYPTQYNKISFSTDSGITWEEMGYIKWKYQGATQYEYYCTRSFNTGTKVMFKANLWQFVEHSPYQNDIGHWHVYNKNTHSKGGMLQKFNVEGNIISLFFTDFISATPNFGTPMLNAMFEGEYVVNARKLSLPSKDISAERASYKYMFNYCAFLATAPELPATTLSEGCYEQMFANCTSLRVAPHLPALTLPNSALGWGCYKAMFSGCTSLVVAPDLPATTIGYSSYENMFKNCTSLRNPPSVLAATTLGTCCCLGMFSNCTSLTTAPELPATTLADNCYAYMFKNCTSLTTSPVLSAATLADYCYHEMFYGCTSLSTITCLATNISARDCTLRWVQGVAPNGIFYKHPSMWDWVRDSGGVPSGWTLRNYSS